MSRNKKIAVAKNEINSDEIVRTRLTMMKFAKCKQKKTLLNEYRQISKINKYVSDEILKVQKFVEPPAN